MRKPAESIAIISMFCVSLGNLTNGIEQLRTCERCHRIFSVLSDLFNHICDDEKDVIRSGSSRLLPSDTKYIPQQGVSSYRPSSSRSLNNDKQQHSSRAYIYLRNPSSPIHRLVT